MATTPSTSTSISAVTIATDDAEASTNSTTTDACTFLSNCVPGRNTISSRQERMWIS